jgi:P4 family phage/plasmid primase-like protien
VKQFKEDHLYVAFAPFKYRRGFDAHWLQEVNKTQCVYFLVNNIAPDATRRTKEDITSVNALFIDMDGKAKWNGADGSIVVGRDATHWHAYWPLVEGESQEKWVMAQKALIKHFDADPQCCDLSRVMRVWGSTNHKKGAENAIYSIWKEDRDKLWTIDEVVGYYGLNLSEVYNYENVEISLDGVSCPVHVKDELVEELEMREACEGERYATARNWSAKALGAGMDSEEVHSIATKALVRWGYEPQHAMRQASNAQSGTVDKIKAGKLSVNERLRPDVAFERVEENKIVENVEEQAEDLGIDSLLKGLKEAEDQYDWMKDNVRRVSRANEIEIARLRKLWVGGIREFNAIVKECKTDDVEDAGWQLIATEFIEARGFPLVYVDAEWYTWVGTHYKVVDTLWVEKEVSAFIDKPSNTKIANLYKQVMLKVLSDRIDEPEGIPFKNGRLIKGKLVPHDPLNGGTYVLSFDYDPRAQCPTWENALKEWFTDVDDKRIIILRQWMQYLLSGREDVQKIMLMMGAQRGGKGTILSVMQDLLGEENYSTPTMTAFSSDFGLESSLGMRAMFISDAHLPKKDRATIMDRLKSISGKDRIDVNRKHVKMAKGKRLGQIVIACNEMEDIRDESNALIDRYSVLKFTKTFLGKEDSQLGAKIRKELSGIFNWAMNCAPFKKFEEDERGRGEKEAMSLSANPVRAWGNEFMEVGEGEVETDEMYRKFQEFCNDNGIHSVPHKNTFMKKIRSVFPDSEIVLTRKGAARFKVLKGVLCRDKSTPCRDKNECRAVTKSDFDEKFEKFKV